jgi:signal transduction histidine kinase
MLQEEVVERQLVCEFGADLKKINSAGKLLLTLMNDILDFAQIEADKLTFEIRDFDLIETAESILDILAERADTKGIGLASAVAPDLPTHYAETRNGYGRS